MIIGADRPAVIENIKKHVEENHLNEKAELDDPEVNEEERKALIHKYLDQKHKPGYEKNARMARTAIKYYGKALNRKTTVKGLEKIKDIDGAAIITCNHFNQIDNTVIKTAMAKKDNHKVKTVIEETNLAMDGFFGFLMNYGDTIPISMDYDYIRNEFVNLLQEAVDEKDYIVIYPEQEMWFNYKRPRPGKRGAYYFASKLGVPVISLFVEMEDLPTKDTDEFYNVKYTVHVLDPIYPDSKLSDRKNSIAMLKKDDEQRISKYEELYRKKIDAPFSYDDIAGYISKA